MRMERSLIGSSESCGESTVRLRVPRSSEGHWGGDEFFGTLMRFGGLLMGSTRVWKRREVALRDFSEFQRVAVDLRGNVLRMSDARQEPGVESFGVRRQVDGLKTTSMGSLRSVLEGWMTGSSDPRPQLEGSWTISWLGFSDARCVALPFGVAQRAKRTRRRSAGSNADRWSWSYSRSGLRS